MSKIIDIAQWVLQILPPFNNFNLEFIKDLIERGKTEEALEKLYEFIEVVEKNNETKLII